MLANSQTLLNPLILGLGASEFVMILIIMVAVAVVYSVRRHMPDSTDTDNTGNNRAKQQQRSAIAGNTKGERIMDSFGRGGSGVRTCAECGLSWQSTKGALKDMGFGASMGGFFDPANLMGLTCTRCGASFCKEHLRMKIPSSLPGGSCPRCRGPMDVG